MTVASQALDQETHVAEGAPGIAGRSPSQMAWARMRRDKVALLSLGVIVIAVILAAGAPLWTRLLGVAPNEFHSNLIGDGALPRQGPLNSGITLDHPLGVEPSTGRDIAARLLYGSRISLLVAGVATILTVIFGTSIGLIAGYMGGRVDSALGRLMDLILAFPQLILLIALSPVIVQVLDQQLDLQGNTGRVIFLVVALSLIGWPYLARIVRGQVLSLREREFVEAAVSMGAGTRRVLVHEMLPNLWVPIIVYASLLLPTFIASEAALSFLGVGVVEPTATWGKMLSDSVQYYTQDPLYLFIPGMALFIVVLAFNLLGDALRDALDPRAGRS